MPFPEAEIVRKAVQDQIQAGFDRDRGDWIAILPDGQELCFRPDEKGEIEVDVALSDDESKYLPDDCPVEKVYKFRVVVEIVEG